MTGWRLGYCIAPPAIARAATLLANNTYACTSTFIQRAGMAALLGDDAPVVAMSDTFRTRRDHFVAALNTIPNVSCPMPEGAFYAFPNITAITHDDVALAKFLLEEAGVALLGGSCFGAAGRGYLRLSYANSLHELDRCVERMRTALPHFPG
jgi:aspartate/methionine/tyrosine aminotransferase